MGAPWAPLPHSRSAEGATRLPILRLPRLGAPLANIDCMSATISHKGVARLSRATSTLAGGFMSSRSLGTVARTIVDIVPYAGFRAFYFLRSAVWLLVAAYRNVDATVSMLMLNWCEQKPDRDRVIAVGEEVDRIVSKTDTMV